MSWMGRASVRRELDGLRLEVAELQASRMRLALAADAERRDLERALHDGVQQQLVGLAANLDLAAASVEVRPCGGAETSRGVAARCARRVGGDADARGPDLSRRCSRPGDLSVALRAAAAGADVPDPDRHLDDGACPVEIAGVVYFCCLDVLERAAPDAVAVNVRDDEGTLAFEIVADGDVGADRPSRDRVEALGGRCAIQSGPSTRPAWSAPCRSRDEASRSPPGRGSRP